MIGMTAALDVVVEGASNARIVGLFGEGGAAASSWTGGWCKVRAAVSSAIEALCRVLIEVRSGWRVLDMVMGTTR